MISNVTSFLADHWGDVASAFGIILTIAFSWSAKRSAEAAREASQSTRSRIHALDLLSELNRLNSRIDDLNHRIERQTWELVNERATDLRVSLAAIIGGEVPHFSEETQGKLTEAIGQFKNMAASADRALMDASSRPDSLRLRRILSDQKETLTLALQEVKTIMGED